jgi:hypothetical protein
MRFRDGSNRETASDCVQILEKVRQKLWQYLDERSGKKARAVHGKSKLTDTEKDETGEEQSQERAHHFL